MSKRYEPNQPLEAAGDALTTGAGVFLAFVVFLVLALAANFWVGLLAGVALLFWVAFAADRRQKDRIRRDRRRHR